MVTNHIGRHDTNAAAVRFVQTCLVHEVDMEHSPPARLRSRSNSFSTYLNENKIEMPFKEDPYVKPLVDGSGLGACWGLAVAVDETGLIDPQWYAAFIEELRKAHPAFRGEDEVGEAYIYKYHALHVTVASPWPFTVESWKELSKDQLSSMVERWRAIVAGATKSVRAGKSGKIALLLNKVQLFPGGVAIFRFDDVDGTVTELRKEILSRFLEAGTSSEKEKEGAEKGDSVDASKSASASANTASAPGAVPESSVFKMPTEGFVHTSFLRWLRIDAEKATEEWERGVTAAFEGAVKSHLAKQAGAAKAWPMPCTFSKVNLFREDGTFGPVRHERVERWVEEGVVGGSCVIASLT